MPLSLRWEERQYTYRYNPAGEPRWLGEGEMRSMIHRATHRWEACGVRFVYQGNTDTMSGVIDGSNVIGWSDKKGSKYSGWTQWQARKSNGALTEADVVLYSNIFDIYRTRGIDVRLELYKTLVHELGHVLGLKHSEQASDAMSVRVRTRPEWHLPSAGDIRQCQELYFQPND